MSARSPTSSTTRPLFIWSAVAGLAWVASPLALPPLAAAMAEGPSHQAILIWSSGVFVLLALVALAARRSIRPFPLARSARSALLFGIVAQTLVVGGTWLLLLWAEAAWAMVFLVWFCATGVFAVALAPGLLPGALSYVGWFVLSARSPESRHWALAAAHAVFALNAITFAWWKGRSQSRS